MVRRVGVLALFLSAFSAAAFIPVPALAGCANANLNNPGHHYGLYKNGCIPAPAPAPVPPAVTHQPSEGATHTLKAGIAHQQPPARVEEQPVEAPIGTAIPPPPDVVTPAGLPFRDPNLWLVTALLPTLLVIWTLIAVRSWLIAYKRRPRQVPVGA